MLALQAETCKDHTLVQVLKEAGVPASLSRHVVVYVNGAFFGLYAFVEQVDETFLRRSGLPEGASLWKASAGQLANLRWDVPRADITWAFSKATRKVREPAGTLGPLACISGWASLQRRVHGFGKGSPLSCTQWQFSAGHLQRHQ